jgi:hypothetical protein
MAQIEWYLGMLQQKLIIEKLYKNNVFLNLCIIVIFTDAFIKKMNNS